MPARCSAAPTGKKTLSDSEVLAYSKNRFVEHSLRRKVRLLSDQEQIYHDRHHQEIQKWRHFMRQSTKTSGAWSTALQSAVDDWPPYEDGVSEQVGNDQLIPAQKGVLKSNLSNELARSLTFQSEALSQLQKPWYYTYSEASHNTMYKEAVQVARVMETRLYFKRSQSSKTPSKYLQGKRFCRSQCSAREVSQEPRGRARPLTGRSTPGVGFKTHAVLHKDKLDRPKTTTGVTRASPLKQKKEAWGDNIQNSNGLQEPHKTEGKTNFCRQRQESKQENRKNVVCETENNTNIVLVDLTKPKDASLMRVALDRTADTEHFPELNTNSNVFTVSNSTSVRTTEDEVAKTEVTSTKTGTSVLYPQSEQGAEADYNRRSVSSDTVANESEMTERTPSKAGNIGTQTLTVSSLKKLRTDSAKKVQIKLTDELTGSDAPQDTETKVLPEQYLSPVVCEQDAKTLLDNGLSLVRDDQIGASLAGKEQIIVAVSSPDQTAESVVSQSQNISESKDKLRRHQPSQSVVSRRGTDVRTKTVISGQLHDVSLTTADTMPADRRGSGVLFRAISSFRRRSSFLVIADQLEALREGNGRRLPRVDDDAGATSPDKRDAVNPQDQTTFPMEEKEVKDKATKAKDNAIQKVKAVKVMAGAASILKKSTKTKHNFENSKEGKCEDGQGAETPEHKHKVEKLEERLTMEKLQEAQHTTKSDAAEIFPIEETSLRNLNKASRENFAGEMPIIEASPELHYSPQTTQDGNGVINWYPSDDNSSCADSDYTQFNGHIIRNYVRPQHRYRSDPFLTNRRERSLFRLSIDYPVYLSGNRGDLKSEMLFPKTCRQKVLQELVQRNNQPAPMSDGGAVPAELRARIDKFLKTLEPYCTNSEIVPE